jgi:ribonuclease VapC
MDQTVYLDDSLDTSALMAIALGEAETDACIRDLETDTEAVISAGTVAEALIVAARRNVGEEVAHMIGGLGFEILSVTPRTPSRCSLFAMGKRYASGTVEFGDCFSYEVAEEHSCPLLYVGNDFSRTDLESAL